MLSADAVSLTCAMISLFEAILLYSPPRYCASKANERPQPSGNQLIISRLIRLIVHAL
ncbi:uncharacterized protein BJ212DRAFT_1392387 [Suillus subaureus]|uniref:Uncharacterized protein n=1 Tax=Suillus subaureus TaxID=48587 RepID=A0A9P7J6Q0_9AGAM|nr:uncharacterized protein BJ212DRAFT_1392387 [Suillus subaureus]KAG1805339.1 hypothetical protein BJ212DRAFT_1392387 [Suillus subaureus]